MFTMWHDITVGSWRLGMLESVEIHRSVELLADTAVIRLPGSEYNAALDVESRIRRGDRVTVRLGYLETEILTEFEGWVQRVGTDNGAITLECEDDLFRMRVALRDRQLEKVSLKDLLNGVLSEIGGYTLDCSYDWTYDRFVINTATGYDVLAKVQEESGADIYLDGTVLHVHPPGQMTGREVIYDFAQNVQSCDLQYRRSDERRVRVVVKALMPDGTVRESEYGAAGGDKVEVRCAATDDASMRSRGESEVRRLSFDGYDGSITGWLVPYVCPGDSAVLYDRDYEYKNGKYFVQAVTTTFGSSGGTRKIELGFRLY